MWSFENPNATNEIHIAQLGNFHSEHFYSLTFRVQEELVHAKQMWQPAS